jgi:putative oxidoreductase
VKASPETSPSLQGLGIAVLRVVTGCLFLASGAQKLIIFDLDRHLIIVDLVQQGNLLPVPIVILGSLVELVCGAALVVGLLTRWASIALALLMLANILVLHQPYEFIEQDHGFEYAALRLAASVALALSGSGRVALDNILARRRGAK